MWSASRAIASSCSASACSSRMQTELPEVATPTEPKVWKKVNSITIAFGHGVSTTPLQTAVGAAALMNGGNLMPPTFLPRTRGRGHGRRRAGGQREDQRGHALSLSAQRREGLRQARRGSRATASAARPARPRRSSTAAIRATSASTPSSPSFPMDDPQYIVLTVIDEPKPEKPGMGATAGLECCADRRQHHPPFRRHAWREAGIRP